jgi:hypothetical protein
MSPSEMANNMFAKGSRWFGVFYLDMMNISILAKWMPNLFNETGLWKQILSNKHLEYQTLCQFSIKKCSQCRMEVKPLSSRLFVGYMLAVVTKQAFWKITDMVKRNFLQNCQG